ncbi:hypothetical protein [Streptomyces sp. NPDC051662]|uniref:hypothetical protein n=1 Tax=Streptomyces sp. NPDC051662 TaxID=3154750 RepID=UPI0034160BE3
MGAGFNEAGLIISLVVLFLCVRALCTPSRREKRRTPRQPQRLSEMDLYALRRQRKNDAIRQMRAVVRDHHNPTSRQRDRREWPS